MSALLQSLLDVPVTDGALSVAAARSLRESGLPTTRNEAWKYTSLRALEARRFGAGDALAAQRIVDTERWALPGVDGLRIVFVNGVFRADLSRTGGLPAGAHLECKPASDAADFTDRNAAAFFSRLNQSLAQEGFVLRIDAGIALSMSVHVIHVGTAADGDVAWNVRSRVDLGAGSSLNLIEHFVGMLAHSHLANHHCAYQLGDGAALHVLQVQDDADGSSLLRRSEFSVGAMARLELCTIELGAALARHEFAINLAGAGAVVESRGAFALRARQHGESRLEVTHSAVDTRCDLLWRGVADQRARGILHGAITIASGADGSDARLSSKNLLLSPHAEIDAQPVLEIHADEVKAAHGATVGQLDERALFYLRSRGVPEFEARALLTSAFCAVVIEALPKALREHLQQLLVAHLPAFGDAEGAP